LRIVAVVVAAVVGTLALIAFAREVRSKRIARTKPSFPARVADVRKAERDTRGNNSGTSRNRFEVDIVFEVPGHAPATRMETFSSVGEAEAWALRYAVGSEHRIRLDPLNGRNAFLEGDEAKINPTGLGMGLGFLGLAALFFFSGP
jgi:hypothetical protein